MNEYQKENNYDLYPNAGQPWSEFDDEELSMLHDRGTSVAKLVKYFGRSPSAIRIRIQALSPGYYRRANDWRCR